MRRMRGGEEKEKEKMREKDDYSSSEGVGLKVTKLN